MMGVFCLICWCNYNNQYLLRWELSEDKPVKTYHSSHSMIWYIPNKTVSPTPHLPFLKSLSHSSAHHTPSSTLTILFSTSNHPMISVSDRTISANTQINTIMTTPSNNQKSILKMITHNHLILKISSSGSKTMKSLTFLGYLLNSQKIIYKVNKIATWAQNKSQGWTVRFL